VCIADFRTRRKCVQTLRCIAGRGQTGITKRYYENWSGRNEVTKTSGRLHHLWPQNKWLHKPRTTDYRHTAQDRWIQTELAFTLAKSATKPNPFEIIPLQITRKENNWKTEEALVRAAVILEMERIKGSNHWCLWWWWWWWWWWPDVYDDDDDIFIMLYSNILYIFITYFIVFYIYYNGDRGSTVVKMLCYKSEGRWFDPSWCHWNS